MMIALVFNADDIAAWLRDLIGHTGPQFIIPEWEHRSLVISGDVYAAPLYRLRVRWR